MPILNFLATADGKSLGRFTVELTDTQVATLGRGAGNAVHVEHATVSRRHVGFKLQGDEVLVHDLGSSHGTLLNGEPVEYAVLSSGDVISAGDVILTVLNIEP